MSAAPDGIVPDTKDWIWDQDATALERDHGSRGLRSNRDEFTVETLASYHLLDIVHHLHGVGAV